MTPTTARLLMLRLAAAGLAATGLANGASAQIGASNNSTNSPLVGSRYEDNNSPEATALLNSRNTSAANRQASKRRPVAAKPADVVVGADVRDSAGQKIGTITSIAASGAVIGDGAMQASVPLDAFGKDRDGLILGITKAQFAALVASAKP